MTVTLRAVRPDDLPTLHAQQSDPVVAAAAAVMPRERAAFDAHWERILVDDTTVTRAIVADGALAGHVVVWGPPDDRLVGYWLGEEFRGRGIATAALRALLELVPERPLAAWVASTNPASVRVLAKCGFTQVAERTEHDPRLDRVIVDRRYELR